MGRKSTLVFVPEGYNSINPATYQYISSITGVMATLQWLLVLSSNVQKGLKNRLNYKEAGF